ncbi:MAG: glycosyltransferase family 4 protein, partial [Thermoproteus sp.]
MYVAVVYDTLSRWGGQELITYAMAKALNEAGYTVDLVLLFDGGLDRRVRDVPARRIIHLFEGDPKLPVRGLARNVLTGLASLGYDLTINTIYHIMFWPFDIGYLNNPGTYMPPYRLRRRAFIEFNRLVLPLLGPKLLLANSRWTLAQLPYRPKMYGVLHPPIMPRPCRADNKEDMVVSIGRIAPDKRTDRVVKIMEKIHEAYPKASLYVIGLPYEKKYFEAVRSLARHVEFVLDASEDVKWSYLCRAKALLHAAINEHFGIVAAEAQFAGAIPVVHKSGGIWSDVVEHGKFGLGYIDEDEAVRNIIRLLSDNNFFNMLSNAAKI